MPPDMELRSMIMAFRKTELQDLLAFARQTKTGRKSDLQARALELVKGDTGSLSLNIVIKIKELYNSMTLSRSRGQLLDPVNFCVTVPESSASFERNVGHQGVIGVDGYSDQPAVPIFPDVTMKELPFYEIMAVLLRPTTLLSQSQSSRQESEQSFGLSPSQADQVSNKNAEVQLRFCAVHSTSTDEQEDQYPEGFLKVKVNGQVVPLPPLSNCEAGVEPKRTSKPLDITNYVNCCAISTNTIQVEWCAISKKCYCLQINLVKRLTADILLEKLKQKRAQPADFTRGTIKEIIAGVEQEDLCAPTNILVSVACPLGKMRMTWPCRASTCKHLQCFDAKLFLQMNERKASFACPVCNQQLKFEGLRLDGYFMDVLKNLSIDFGNEIELFADGSWLPARAPKRLKTSTEPPVPVFKQLMEETTEGDEEIVISDGDQERDLKPVGFCTSTAGGTSSSSSTKLEQSAPEVVDLRSSDEEEGSAQW